MFFERLLVNILVIYVKNSVFEVPEKFNPLNPNLIIINPKKTHQPEMELGENLKEHFSKITFYGLHAGNNQNSI